MERTALRDQIKALIRDYPDFPSKGILFRDVLPIFAEPALVHSLCKFIANSYRSKVDIVAGIEARGFLFGPIVALELGLPFIPIRKKGKLPGQLYSVSYQKEYGPDILEMQTEPISKGQRILLVDDLLATGGTLRAAEQMIESTGAHVAAVFVLVELTALKGRDALKSPIDALISYTD